MPHRLVSAAILALWTVAAAALFTRDILPNLIVGPPPDLRAVIRAEDLDRPSHWAILVEDDAGPGRPEVLRSVGQVVTRSNRQADGWYELKSEAWIDSGEALKGTPLGVSSGSGERFELGGEYSVDPSGNLDHFRVHARAGGGREEIVTVSGKLQKDELVVTSRSPLSLMLNVTKRLPYQSRGMVQGSFSPLDRLPGLKVGQRWVSRVVSPITGKVEEGKVEVTRKHAIHWGGNPVTTYEVVTRVGPVSARTWVRPGDGLVLRQELPLPFVRLRLERMPDLLEPASADEGNRR